MINRRDFCKTTGAAALGALSGTLGCNSSEAKHGHYSKKRPNLLFVFSDQQSWDMLGCYGNQDIITPNLDKLASEGVQFNHCVSSCPVCTPFRGMLMSGQHPLYNGAYINDVPLLADNGKYIGHVLKDAGYRTGYIGKWHLLGGERRRPIPAGPMRYGFDEVFWTNNCHVDYRPGHCFYWNEKGERVYFDEWEVYGQTNQALDFLDRCTQDDPFALFVSWHPPHDWGWQGNSMVRRYDTIKELMDLYDPDKLKLRPHVKDSKLVRHAYHGHYAMCSGVDIAFGQLMDKLKDKGLDENTLIVFTSDHGDNLSSYDFTLPKNHPEDTSVRVPMLMRMPKHISYNYQSDMLFGSLDIMPTLLRMMNLSIPNTVQGKDLSRAILKKQQDAVDSVPLFFYEPSWRGIYTRQHTFAYGETAQWRMNKNGKRSLGRVSANVLYDRSKDPHQLNNQYGQQSVKALQEKLYEQTQQWMKKFGDTDFDSEQLRKIYLAAGKGANISVKQDGFPGRPVDIVARL